MNRKKLANFLKTMAFLTALSLLMVPVVSATSISSVSVPSEASSYIAAPGENHIAVLNFTILDGGDSKISGDLKPGEELFDFEKNRTMFLNQTDTGTTGQFGFDDGEDILSVEVIHSAGNTEMLNGTVVGNFSSDIFFADGGNRSDGVFNGDNSSGNPSEALIKDNGTSGPGVLDRNDYVVSRGYLNLSNFSDQAQFVDLDTDNGRFDPGTEALIRNTGSDLKTLEEADSVVMDGAAGLNPFRSAVKFADGTDNDGGFEENNVIIHETGDRADILEADDQILLNGSLDVNVTSSTNLSYYNSSGSSSPIFDNEGEPIYYENVQDGTVNKSDIRIGEVKIVSWNDRDPSTLDLNLSTLSVVMNGSGVVSDAEIGKNISNVTNTNTGYAGEGTFQVYEYSNGGNAPDGVWNPGTGDQDVLIYDLQGDTPVSAGETLIYNSNLYSGNIASTVLPGDEFNSTEASNTLSAENSYQPDVSNITFDGSDSTYDPGQDNVTVNISHGGNSRVVVLTTDKNGELGYQGSLHQGGFMRFWNADGASDGERADGLFVDMDRDGNVSEGDVRIGEWIRNRSAGSVQQGDVDMDANITGFSNVDDHVRTVDADHDNFYSPGDGTVSSSTGREAIFMSSDNTLDSTDEVVRSGKIDLIDFDGQSTAMRYSDANQDGVYTGGEAIVANDGGTADVLEEGDTVLQPGSASLTNLSDETRYVENGDQSGFERGSSEAIVWDASADGVFATGELETSSDRVLRSGDANLVQMPQPPVNEGESGFIYMDKNQSGEYQPGEDILNLTLVTNGSVSNSINGTELFNFANSTKHNGSQVYQDGNGVANDTDDNGVYKDVLRSVEVVNELKESSPDFLENITEDDVESGVLSLFRDTSGNKKFDSGTDEQVAELNYVSSAEEPTWNISGMTQNITEDTSFFVTFNSTSTGKNYAYGFQAGTSGWGTAGGDSLQDVSNNKKQIVDTHAPEIVDAWTGNTSGGNSHKDSRNRIYVKTNEQYQGLNYGDVEAGDFAIYFKNSTRFDVVNATESRSSGDFELVLNESFETNRTFELYLGGEIRDLAGNLRQGGDQGTQTEVSDGLRPRIMEIIYEDNTYNGTIDEIDILFSENITYSSFEETDWKFTDRGLEGLDVTSGITANNPMLDLNATADPWITGVDNQSREPSLNYTALGSSITDQSGNDLGDVENYTMDDGAGPVIANATTEDADNDAEIDQLFLNFSERLDDVGSVLESDSIDITSPSIGKVDSVTTLVENDRRIRLNVSDIGNTSVTPSLNLENGTMYDSHGNTIRENQVFNSVLDDSNPILLAAEVNHILSNSTETFVDLQFSEPVKDVRDDSKGVNISNKSFDFNDSSENTAHTVSYGETLQTGNYPNVTSLVNVTDLNNNSALLKNNESVTVNTFRKEMEKGWNFVSLPLATGVSPRINQTLNESKVSVVWTHTGEGWKTYDPDTYGVSDFEHFTPGRGYLVNATESFTLEVNADTPLNMSENDDSTEKYPRPTLSIDQGWQLLGHHQEYTLPANQTENSNPPGAFKYFSQGDLGIVYEQAQEGTAAVSEMGRNENLQTGSAYWVLAEDDATYTAAQR